MTSNHNDSDDLSVSDEPTNIISKKKIIDTAGMSNMLIDMAINQFALTSGRELFNNGGFTLANIGKMLAVLSLQEAKKIVGDLIDIIRQFIKDPKQVYKFIKDIIKIIYNIFIKFCDRVKNLLTFRKEQKMIIPKTITTPTIVPEPNHAQEYNISWTINDDMLASLVKQYIRENKNCKYIKDTDISYDSNNFKEHKITETIEDLVITFNDILIEFNDTFTVCYDIISNQIESFKPTTGGSKSITKTKTITKSANKLSKQNDSVLSLANLLTDDSPLKESFLLMQKQLLDNLDIAKDEEKCWKLLKDLDDSDIDIKKLFTAFKDIYPNINLACFLTEIHLVSTLDFYNQKYFHPHQNNP